MMIDVAVGGLLFFVCRVTMSFAAENQVLFFFYSNYPNKAKNRNASPPAHSSLPDTRHCSINVIGAERASRLTLVLDEIKKIFLGFCFFLD